MLCTRLKILEAHQNKFASSPIHCMLHGMAGIGKTEIALEYSYRNRDKYECIFWVSAENYWQLEKTDSAIRTRVGVKADVITMRN